MMFWAIGQGDQNRLEQIVSRARDSQPVDELTLPKQDWDKIAAVQFASVTVTSMPVEGGREETGSVEAIVEREASQGKDVDIYRWILRKINEQWLITRSF